MIHELDQIVELIQLAYREAASARGGPVFLRREARPLPPEDGLEDLLDSEDSAVMVGTIDNAIVGYGVVAVETLRDGGRLAVVEDIYVRQEAREVGVGQALLAALADWSRDQGCFAIDALVLPGDRASKNFFEGQGMTTRALVVHRALDSMGEGA
ncbi:MAG: hypothetical protein JJLCMIEE_00296 [Acidimicrobiales bacterium]|nr:hypothetical protein [Acidimicrobiales bacterium]